MVLKCKAHVGGGYEQQAAKASVWYFNRLGCGIQTLVPKINLKTTAEPPVLIANHVFVALTEPQMINECMGIWHVAGFLSVVGNPYKPETITNAVMHRFLSELNDWNSSLTPKTAVKSPPPTPKPSPTVHPTQGAKVKVLGSLTGEVLSTKADRSVVGLTILGRLVEASVSRRTSMELS